jgi:CheY-like chemotaxis protein
MSSDELPSILELGWQSSREAWQLLAPNDDGEFTTTGASQTGRAMDQLAYDLRRIGYATPARLAFSAAFVLNSLASGTITFEPEIAEKTSQIVTVLAEMLLELEAAKEITIQEPVEIVEELKSNWGLEFDAEQAESVPMAPQAVEFEVIAPAQDHELVAISQELVQASGSLLERVIRESVFPHTAALGRIHHLATLVRDHVITDTQTYRAAEISGYSEELLPRPTLPCISIPQGDIPLQLVESLDQPQIDVEISDRRPGVLILDRSPFIRMLLTTAIESAGYIAMASADCLEVLEGEHSRPWNMVICGIDNLSDSSRELLSSRVASWGASVVMFDEGQGQLIAVEQHQLKRSDLEGLLSLIKSKLGPINRPMLMSA